MFERFTDRARKVMAMANQEAQYWNHEYIGTEHILLGLVKEGTGVGANVLKTLDVELRQVRLEVERLMTKGKAVSVGRLPQTQRARNVITFAIEEARQLHHNYVGTEHILLGLLREKDGVAARVLINLRLNLEQVRKEVLDLLGAGTQTQAEETAERSAAGEQHRDHPLVVHLVKCLEAYSARMNQAIAAGEREKVDELRSLMRELDAYFERFYNKLAGDSKSSDPHDD